MPILKCFVDEETFVTLQIEAEHRGRDETATHLAENAIAEAALNARKARTSLTDQEERS